MHSCAASLLARTLGDFVRQAPLGLVVHLGDIGRCAIVANLNVYGVLHEGDFVVSFMTKQTDLAACTKPENGEAMTKPAGAHSAIEEQEFMGVRMPSVLAVGNFKGANAADRAAFVHEFLVSARRPKNF